MANNTVELLLALTQIVLETVAEADPATGAPSGPMYAAFMTKGMTLENYQNMMSGMVSGKLLTLNGNCYHITEDGKKFLEMLKARAAK
jgi:hypothetical protein